MANCPVCNSPLEPGARFCSVCGTPAPAEAPAAAPAMVYCPSCGRQNAADSQFCELCGTPLESPAAPTGGFSGGDAGGGFTGGPVSGGAHTAKKVRMPGAGGGFKLPSKRILLFGGIALAAIIVIIVVILLLSGGGKSSNNIFYIKDKELYSAPLSGKKSEQVTSSMIDSGSSSTTIGTTAGERIGYFVFLAKDGKTLFYPDRISSSSSSGFTLYYRTLGSKRDSDGTKIDTDVKRYAVNDKTDTVTYLKDGGNIYQYSLKKNSKEKLTGSATTFYVDDNGSRILFRNDENTLYSMVVGKDKEKIDSDVTGISYVSDDCKTVVYMKDDSLYRKVEGKDREKISSDVSGVIAAYDSGEIYYRKYDEENNLVLTHMSDNGSSDSDWLRSNLEGETLWNSLYTICYYDGKTSTVLTDSNSGWRYNSAGDSPAIIFLAVDEDKYDTPRLSDYDYYYDAKEAVDEAMSDALTVYTAKGSKVTAVSGDYTDFYSYRISESGKTAWFLCDYEDGSGTLYKLDVGSSKAEKYEDDVYSVLVNRDAMLAYFKDYQSKDNTATLCVDGKKVEDDVYVDSYRFKADEKKMLYFTDYDDDKSRGTLHLYSGGKTSVVGDDVYYAVFAPDDSVLYLSDYSTTRYRGDLYRYDGGKSTKLDDDVNAIVPISSTRKYMYYYSY